MNPDDKALNSPTSMVVTPDSQSTQGYLISSNQIQPGTITPLMLAATPTVANGDTYYSNGTTFERLPAGSEGSIQTIINGIPAFIPPGTNGQVLEIVSNVPAWATPPSTNPDPLIANALNARTTSDILITAGTSKVVKESMVVQNDTTNSYQVGFMQSGWGQFDISSGAHVGSDSITLPITFPSTIISVVVNLIGTTLGTVTDITSFTTSASTTGLVMAFHADTLTTAGFKVSIFYSGNVGATTHVGYGWIATGY